jgi:hypothetical protein
MDRKTLSDAASVLGRRSYQVRLERLGIERIREIARLNGRKGGRPPKPAKEEKTDGPAEH